MPMAARLACELRAIQWRAVQTIAEKMISREWTMDAPGVAPRTRESVAIAIDPRPWSPKVLRRVAAARLAKLAAAQTKTASAICIPLAKRRSKLTGMFEEVAMPVVGQAIVADAAW